MEKASPSLTAWNQLQPQEKETVDETTKVVEESLKNQYLVLEKVGQGVFGEVYKGITRKGVVVAIKKLKYASDYKKLGGLTSTVLREISILKAYRHRNLIRLYEVIYEKENLYMIFEFCELDLKSFLDKFKPKLPILPLKLLYDLLRGVQFLHSNSIIHRDLKPQNILIDLENQRAKVADFGLARHCPFPNGGMTPEVVSLYYRAPELLLKTQFYDFKVDMYSLGCIFYELYHFQILVEGQSEINQLYKIYKTLGPPTLDPEGNPVNPQIQKNFSRNTLWHLNKHMDSKTFDLFEKMVRVDPEQRISAEWAVAHIALLRYR